MIATSGRAELLSRTLTSLARARLSEPVSEVWVVENGSPPQVEDLVLERAWPFRVRYAFLEAPGKSGALNHAVQEASGDLIVFLDDDVRVEEDLLEAYLEASDAHRVGAFFVGAVHPEYEQGPPPPEWLVDYLPLSAKGNDPSLGIRQVLGGNFAAYRTDILSVGGFDTELGSGALGGVIGVQPVGEETELVERLAASGCAPVAVPDAAVWHWVPRDRCSPQWALDRLSRHAFTAGLRFSRAPSGRLWMGAPRVRWRLALASAFRVAMVRLWGSEESRFLARASLNRELGFIRGARHGRRHHPDPADATRRDRTPSF